MMYRPVTSTVLAAAFLAAAAFATEGQTGKEAGKVDLSKAALRNPAGLKEKAPDTFRADFVTSAGTFVIEVHRDWSPNGADRFYNLVKHGFYDNCRFFRVIPNFMVQFGINGDPAVSAAWANARIPDEPVKQSNVRSNVSFAKGGPNSRSTQVFINYRDNGKAGSMLDAQGFSPFGQVISGMDVVDKLYGEYGENAQRQSPRISAEGNSFLAKQFPKLDYIKKATIEKPKSKS